MKDVFYGLVRKKQRCRAIAAVHLETDFGIVQRCCRRIGHATGCGRQAVARWLRRPRLSCCHPLNAERGSAIASSDPTEWTKRAFRRPGPMFSAKASAVFDTACAYTPEARFDVLPTMSRIPSGTRYSSHRSRHSYFRRRSRKSCCQSPRLPVHHSTRCTRGRRCWRKSPAPHRRWRCAARHGPSRRPRSRSSCRCASRRPARAAAPRSACATTGRRSHRDRPFPRLTTKRDVGEKFGSRPARSTILVPVAMF